MLTELILSALILTSPVSIIKIPTLYVDRDTRVPIVEYLYKDRSGIALKALSCTEISYIERLISGYGNITSFEVLDKNGNLVTLVNVPIYNKYKDSFNMRDGRLFFNDLKALLSHLDFSGIPLTALLAQAYTEGGAGKSGLYTHSNNLFGLRAGPAWDGFVYARDKRTTYDSYNTARANGAKDLFRAYLCVEDSIGDYIDLIRTSSRYRSALNKSSKRYLKALTKNGYGDPNMVSVWTNIIKLYKLEEN